MSLNFAEILRGGQSLVPNLREQMYQDSQADMQRQQFDMQKQDFAQKQADAQKEMVRKAEFERARDGVLMSGRPDDIQRLMIQFPEYAASIKPAFDALDEKRRVSDLTQMGSMYYRANNGDYAGAASQLRARIESDRAAGESDPADEALLTALESGDPQEQRMAAGVIGMQVAALDPDKFGDVYGKLNPSDSKIGVQKEYDWRVGRFGQEKADQWLATNDLDIVTVEKGGSAFDKADFANGGSPRAAPKPQGGGDPASSADYAMPVEGGTFTSGLGDSRDGGTRSHNGQDISVRMGAPVRPVRPGVVEGVGSDGKAGKFVKVRHPDGSYSSYSHLGNQSVAVGDQVGGDTVLGTAGRSGNARGSQAVLHLVMRDAQGRVMDPKGVLGGASGVVAVKSIQQANALKPGTRYTTPDGRSFVR